MTGSNAAAASGPEVASFPLAREEGIAPLPSPASGGGSASSRKRSAWVGQGSGIGDLGGGQQKAREVVAGHARGPGHFPWEC